MSPKLFLYRVSKAVLDPWWSRVTFRIFSLILFCLFWTQSLAHARKVIYHWAFSVFPPSPTPPFFKKMLFKNSSKISYIYTVSWWYPSTATPLKLSVVPPIPPLSQIHAFLFCCHYLIPPHFLPARGHPASSYIPKGACLPLS